MGPSGKLLLLYGANPQEGRVGEKHLYPLQSAVLWNRADFCGPEAKSLLEIVCCGLWHVLLLTCLGLSCADLLPSAEMLSWVLEEYGLWIGPFQGVGKGKERDLELWEGGGQS